MINCAIKDGKIKTGDTIIEPTSGNTGIGIAMVACVLGLKAIIVMPETMSIERQKMMKVYGAKVILTEGKEGMSGAIKKATELARENNYFLVGQFDNPDNVEAHKKTTALEIYKDFQGDLDAVVAGIGTGGTITGIGLVLKEKISKIKIFGVEPETSAVLSGGKKGPHGIQGIGAGFIPKVLDTNIYDEIIKMSDNESFETAREMAKNEGLFVGISSGAAVGAAIKVAKKLGSGKKVLAICPDSGLKYLSTKLV
jgi:cysteine synthase A